MKCRSSFAHLVERFGIDITNPELMKSTRLAVFAASLR